MFEHLQLVRTDIESQCFLLTYAYGLRQSIEDDRQKYDTQAGLQTLASIGLGEPKKDFPPNAATTDQWGDNQHGERHHHGLVNAHQDRR